MQDLGAGWTQYRKAGGFARGDAKSCSYRFGSPLKMSDRGYAGPMFADATKTIFAYSTALVFRSEAAAKAYTAARSDARSTAELAEKGRADAAERASFDPFFTFFRGGVAAFEGDRRVGAVGVSGLPGPDDDALARRALEAAGLST